MLLWLTQYLEQFWYVFHVFQYITFRCILAALTALIFSFVLGPFLIKSLNRYRVGQTIRNDGPQSHLIKTGTPTMGGALILLSIACCIILWGDLSNRFLWVTLAVTLGFGLIGWVDDYLKLTRQSVTGLRPAKKYLSQSFVGLSAAIFLYFTAQYSAETQLTIPFFKYVIIKLGLFYIVFSYFVIVGASNAVNLTDGLDGLATLPAVMIAAALGVFAYLTGNFVFARYLYIPFIPGVGEIAVFCSAIVGAGLGFLWFNTYPAEIFMGDVGSIGLGGAIGTVAILIKQELLLFSIGGIFVLEALSVILQVGSFKFRGKRILKMAPLHHHFELLGWSEVQIVQRFWLVAILAAMLGIALALL